MGNVKRLVSAIMRLAARTIHSPKQRNVQSPSNRGVSSESSAESAIIQQLSDLQHSQRVSDSISLAIDTGA